MNTPNHAKTSSKNLEAKAPEHEPFIAVWVGQLRWQDSTARFYVYPTWYLAREACAAFHGTDLDSVHVRRASGDAEHYTFTGGEYRPSRIRTQLCSVASCDLASSHEGDHIHVPRTPPKVMAMAG